MAVFLVERSVPGMTVQDLQPAVHALEESCRRLAPAEVRHVLTMLIVEGSRCLSVFEAERKDVVMRANSAAQFPFSAIEEVAQVLSQGDQKSQ